MDQTFGTEFSLYNGQQAIGYGGEACYTLAGPPGSNNEDEREAGVGKTLSFTSAMLAHILLRQTSLPSTDDKFNFTPDYWESSSTDVSASSASFSSVTSGVCYAGGPPPFLPPSSDGSVAGRAGARSPPSRFLTIRPPSQSFTTVEISQSSAASAHSLASFTFARNQVVASQTAAGSRQQQQPGRSCPTPIISGKKRADPSPAASPTPAAPERTSDSKSPELFCRINGCGSDISSETAYFRKYKFCRSCVRDESVVFKGERQRFCQQCSFFHPVAEFEGLKRSCRAKLQRHKTRTKPRTSKAKIMDGGTKLPHISK